MNKERRMVREFFEGYNRNIANRQNLEFKFIDWKNYSNSGDRWSGQDGFPRLS